MSKPASIALGFFDGVHIAHQKIIKSAVDFAKENGLCAVALSFDASPLEILLPGIISYITENSEKLSLIESLGATVEFLNLCSSLLALSPEEFVSEILIKKYNAKHVVCGYNYHFGKGGSGNTETLKNLGAKYGFSVKVLEKETLNGEEISSSHIRELISDGRISEANKLLGRNFSFSGTVCEGKKLGHTLGFPTANVFMPDTMVFPRKGVYKTIVTAEGKSYVAITNTGVNPTVGGEKFHTETYIPRFDGILYGKTINIEFVDFIRPEKSFENISKLQEQIKKDIESL